jgi:hypothetical protein
MNKHRLEAIQKKLCFLHETHESFLLGTKGCDFECQSVMYGALAKQIRSSHHLSPWPVAPFLGLSYTSLSVAIASFTSPSWRKSPPPPPSPRNHFGSYSQNSCGQVSDDQARHTCTHSSFTPLFSFRSHLVTGLNLTLPSPFGGEFGSGYRGGFGGSSKNPPLFTT